MARPATIRTDAILDAARKVFLRHGYKASTAQVAREAGVSEGSLFKRFRNKMDLFLAAMAAEERETRWEDDLLRSVGKGEVRAALESAGMRILEDLEVSLPRVIMVRSSGLVIGGHGRPDVYRGPGPMEKMRVLTRYFRAEAKLGRLNMDRPAVQAHIFLSALTHYVVNAMLFGIRSASPAVYVRTVVNMIVHSATPPAGGRGRRS